MTNTKILKLAYWKKHSSYFFSHPSCCSAGSTSRQIFFKPSSSRHGSVLWFGFCVIKNCSIQLRDISYTRFLSFSCMTVLFLLYHMPSPLFNHTVILPHDPGSPYMKMSLHINEIFLYSCIHTYMRYIYIHAWLGAYLHRIPGGWIWLHTYHTWNTLVFLRDLGLAFIESQVKIVLT
jgi:hypothetical protein